MEKLIIDRIENGIAVCEREDRSHWNIPLDKLYAGAREGDHLVFTDGEYRRDVKGKETAKSRNRRLENKLFDEE